MIQAVVFLLVGLSFVYRLALLGEPEDFEEHFVVNLRAWYWFLDGRRLTMLSLDRVRPGWRGLRRVRGVVTMAQAASAIPCWRSSDYASQAVLC